MIKIRVLMIIVMVVKDRMLKKVWLRIFVVFLFVLFEKVLVFLVIFLK